MKLPHLLRGALLAVVFATGLAQATPAPITGGITKVDLTAAPVLTGAGIAVGTLGTATAATGSDGFPVVSFPITGGTFDPVTFAGGIEHDGSGLSFTKGSTVLNLTNFFIDTVNLKLFGDAAFGTTTIADLPLFNIGLSGNTTFPFTLALTSDAAGALTTLFALPNLTGVTIGLASTAPITAAVPEPASYALLALGLVGIGVTTRRRRGAREAVAAAMAA